MDTAKMIVVEAASSSWRHRAESSAPYYFFISVQQKSCCFLDITKEKIPKNVISIGFWNKYLAKWGFPEQKKLTFNSS